jgi:hypothetical protein
MPSLIPTLLNFALPLATSYAEEQAAVILRDGVPLTAEQIIDARRVGVKEPQRVRLLKVESIPVPTQPALAKANEYVSMVGPQSISIIYGYGVYLRQDQWDNRPLIVHELVHISQYERLGSIGDFLKAYLSECLTVGHDNSPMEREAVNRSKEVCGL